MSSARTMVTVPVEPRGSVDALDYPARIRRILFRSRQRGWLELDVLLGRWAADNIAGLSVGEVEQLERLLDAETPDLFRWIASEDPCAPAEFDGSVLSRIRAHTHQGNAVRSKEKSVA